MEAYRFDPEAVRDRLVELIRETAAAQGFSRVVVGISGGKDSTVTAALCARALGKENVYGVMLPDGEQKDISDSRAVCGAIRPAKEISPVTLTMEETRSVESSRTRTRIGRKRMPSARASWSESSIISICRRSSRIPAAIRFTIPDPFHFL